MDTKYEVKQDLPLPKMFCRHEYFPFKKLVEIGQYFETTTDLTEALRSSAQYQEKKLGVKFSVRKDRKAGVTRCFRVA